MKKKKTNTDFNLDFAVDQLAPGVFKLKLNDFHADLENCLNVQLEKKSTKKGRLD